MMTFMHTFTNIIWPPRSLPPAVPLMKQKVKLEWPKHTMLGVFPKLCSSVPRVWVYNAAENSQLLWFNSPWDYHHWNQTPLQQTQVPDFQLHFPIYTLSLWCRVLDHHFQNTGGK